MRMRSLACIGVAALGASIGASSASSEAGSFGYQHLGTECMVTQSAYGHHVSARTHWRMWNSPHSANDLDGYRWQARLIATTPGLSLHRPWERVELSEIDGDGLADHRAVVTTPSTGAYRDWNLQVKLTWDRAGRGDWNVERVLPFDEASCAVS